MNRYKELEKLFVINTNEQDDRKLIISLVLKSSFYLLDQVNDLIEENRSTLVFSLLRQVYEYIISFIGLTDLNLPIESFFNNPQKFRNKVFLEIKKKNHEYVTKHNTYPPDDFLKSIREVLNLHTHAGFERMLHTLLEILGDDKTKNFQKQDARNVFLILEILLIKIVNYYYKSDHPIQSLNAQHFGYVFKALEPRDYLPKQLFDRLGQISAVAIKRQKSEEEIKQFIDYLRLVKKVR